MTKRLFDLVVSGAGLAVLLPIMGVIGLANVLLLGRPVFFSQQRPGLGGRPFKLLKFRSMTVVRDAAGASLADAQRLTRYGRLLRSTSLDELPQLINILRGDLSVVGPRPLLMQYLPLYSAEQRRRHTVKPGLTGWAQINGRNALSWEEKFALDLWYVDHRSLWLDIYICWKTVGRLLRRSGISHGEQPTMPPFTGTTNSVPLENTPPEIVPTPGGPAFRP